MASSSATTNSTTDNSKQAFLQLVMGTGFDDKALVNLKNDIIGRRNMFNNSYKKFQDAETWKVIEDCNKYVVFMDYILKFVNDDGSDIVLQTK
ncbi:unnamed protein product [Adineta steineri]|uniref:Uncharacterized protein n=1 Tax=Adineta steineri TaxID=433720 RepID=A0A814P5M2_9BILA|nr:unnamed protein product [Adineta steineri]CAF3660725.1 unnamed protein product [Adineta steineri]